MSPRAVKVTITLLIVATLLAIAYVIVPKVGIGHRNINTSGKIVFLSTADSQGLPHVFIIDQSGSSLRDLTPGAQSCADPSFSPDGSQITYVSDKLGQPQVFIIDADGLHPHAVTFGTAAKSSPEFTPDGKSLSFISEGTITALDLQSNETDLLRTTPDSSSSPAGVVTNDSSHIAVLSYAWSPQPSNASSQEPALAAVQEEIGVPGAPDQEVLTELTSPDAAPVVLLAAPTISITWSPDGTKLFAAVIGARGPNQQTFSGIVAYNSNGKPAGTPPLAATGSASVGPLNPTVSTDGKSILFLLNNNPDLAHNTTVGLFVQPADGSAQARALISGPVKFAEWSPTSKRLLVLLPRQNSPGRDLWVGPTDGTGPPSNLTLGAGDVSWAQWSPSVGKEN